MLPMSSGRRRCFTIVFYIGALALALLTSDLGELFTIFGSLCGWATLFAVGGAATGSGGGVGRVTSGSPSDKWRHVW